jgi:hypothetical protein
VTGILSTKKAELPLVEVDGAAVDLPTPEPGEHKAEPKPGDADYDWAEQYGTDDLYRHTFADGTVVALKSFASIYSKTWLYKIRSLPTEAQVEFSAIDRASCDAARRVLADLDDTDGDPLDDLFTSWTAAATSRGDGDKGLTAGN